uniref:Uncharacterized protein n=1 Tax=Arundo donax TaxID=35708 RepID=A0A0A8YGY7_ARUDO
MALRLRLLCTERRHGDGGLFLLAGRCSSFSTRPRTAAAERTV